MINVLQVRSTRIIGFMTSKNFYLEIEAHEGWPVKKQHGIDISIQLQIILYNNSYELFVL